MNALLVAVGGAAGSLMRYWLSGVAQRWVSSGAWAAFPLGTLVVNVAGCFLVGALAEIGERRGLLAPGTRALLMVGFLGGFTTFSAFAHETVVVWRSGAAALSLANVALSVVLCLAAVVAGRGVAAAVVR